MVLMSEQIILKSEKQIGYLPENNPLYPEMYVREYLGFVASVYNIGKSKKKQIDNIICNRTDSRSRIKRSVHFQKDTGRESVLPRH